MTRTLHTPPPYIFKTVLIMDICTIGLIKERHKIPSGKDENKKERLEQLISYAKKGSYKFSFILAITEKATDKKNRLSRKEMIERFRRDHRTLVGIIGERNMAENQATLKRLISIIMDENYGIAERAELLLDEYLEFLSFYNELNVRTDPAKEDRLPLAKKITERASQLGISAGHPVVAICVASVYGCADARRILKVNRKGEFNPSNAYGDIQSFYRVAKARHMINQHYPGMRLEFRTEDKALEDMHTYYKAIVLHEDDGVPLYGIPTIHDEKMFPRLFSRGKCLSDEELSAVYLLLNFRKKADSAESDSH